MYQSIYKTYTFWITNAKYYNIYIIKKNLQIIRFSSISFSYSENPLHFWQKLVLPRCARWSVARSHFLILLGPNDWGVNWFNFDSMVLSRVEKTCKQPKHACGTLRDFPRTVWLSAIKINIFLAKFIQISNK